MEIAGIYPETIHIIIDFTLSNLQKIKLALEMMGEIELAGMTDEEKESVKFLEVEFYPYVKKVVDDKRWRLMLLLKRPM